MNTYERIEKAIIFLKENFRSQPDLEETARQAYLSPFHFQRLFQEWAGVSPKKFLQFLSVEYAKTLLKQNHSLLEASYETGLSGSGRLHDLFINIEAMSPGEFKNGGESLSIEYSFCETRFGNIIVASTNKGICHLGFAPEESPAPDVLKQQFPRAVLVKRSNAFHKAALDFFKGDWTDVNRLKLHLRGTAFQLKIWRTLLQVPFGEVSSYAALAKMSDSRGTRAVASAVARNPVAFLIPCHRVIRSSGITGEYHWGSARKSAMLGWEAAQVHGPAIAKTVG